VTAQEAFDALVRDHIASPLKALGFKRTRATFHRPVERNWEVINLQRSQFSSRGTEVDTPLPSGARGNSIEA